VELPGLRAPPTKALAVMRPRSARRVGYDVSAAFLASIASSGAFAPGAEAAVALGPPPLRWAGRLALFGTDLRQQSLGFGSLTWTRLGVALGALHRFGRRWLIDVRADAVIALLLLRGNGAHAPATYNVDPGCAPLCGSRAASVASRPSSRPARWAGSAARRSTPRAPNRERNCHVSRSSWRWAWRWRISVRMLRRRAPTLMEMTARRPIDAVLDETALTSEQIYRRHAQQVARWAARLAGPALDVEDLVQEIFLKVHRGRDAFRGDCRLATWLYCITERVVYARRRRERIRRFLGGTIAADDTPATDPTPVQRSRVGRRPKCSTAPSIVCAKATAPS